MFVKYFIFRNTCFCYISDPHNLSENPDRGKCGIYTFPLIDVIEMYKIGLQVTGIQGVQKSHKKIIVACEH